MADIHYTHRWQQLRQIVLARDPVCVFCRMAGLTAVTEEVDHITPVADGGDPWSVDNLQGLCRPCHEMKTSMENKQRSKGNRFTVDPDGRIVGGRPE